MVRRLLPVVYIVALLWLQGLAGGAQSVRTDPAGGEFFETKVRPLLIDHCYSCHAGAAKGGLRLDTRAGVRQGGVHGPALVPGQPEASLLIKAVRYADKTLQMPPAGKLSDEQIAILTEWVRIGAPDPREAAPAKPMGMSLEQGRKHWSFLPLKRPTPPPVKAAAWCRTPIDRFILAKLEPKGLKPNPEAEKRTLIRRVYFDLIGLPPTPEEVNAFLADKRPDAYEKLIDRLLANPHYGERWGRHWLDLARFAESHGYEQDYDRPYAYYYRDFVVKALNADIPYDQFCRWQLAGDEFAPDDPMALMATGFLAAGTHATQITKNQVEKERYDELDDMLSTTGTAMLGLTIGCARCHDHKYDPIPNRDYYRMLSTFTTTVRSDLDVNMDPEGYRKAREKFDADHAVLVEARQKFENEPLPQRMEQWLKGRTGNEPTPAWQVLDLAQFKSAGDATFTPQEDGSVLASGKNPDKDTYTLVARTQQRGITAIRLEALADPSMVKGGPGRAANGNFALTDFRVTAAPVDGSGPPVAIKLVHPRATFEQKGLPISAAIDDDAKSAWAIDPQFGKNHAAVFDTATPVGYTGGTVLTFTLKFENNTGHNIGRPRLSISTVPPPASLDGPSRPEPVVSLLARLRPGEVPADPQDRALLLGWYRTQDPEWQKLDQAVQAHLALAPPLLSKKILICSEGVPAVRTNTQGGDFLEQTFFLKRGDPNQKLAVATQGFLQVLMEAPEGERRWQVSPPSGWRTSYRRRALANWITDTQDGAGRLLARVIVNRLWQHHFGRGIVATPSDFGAQGERPTHPELLDWLATELIRNGWHLKPIHKLILTSAVYRESSASSPVSAKSDPDNKLCWRHSRQRLEAEIIRDSLLAVSGMLDTTMYGPGTLDEKQTRRSLYFFVKRSKLIPSMMLFDAPNALLGLAVRSTTTIAPQALMLMNNPNVREYARHFAQRIAPQPDTPLTDTVQSGYQIALGRRPTPKERLQSLAFLNAQAASYRQAGRSDAQAQALDDFCQVLMGLNEFIYIE